ncbi:hypothetical protein [Priestia megaterium]|uniref:hypothetical protein n=1 Tax=Priestia megaterium TaxID=1404 RepID=UPI000BFB82B1|nr:hypothetical protein [Priestia megaterium]PGQ88221.1 hypothetical protein COA18_04660 [Priestia megaterium]
MKVPAGVKEYQDSIMESKDLLQRLKKGSRMLTKAIKNDEIGEARKMISLWAKYAERLMDHMELATIIHQQYMTENSVVLTSNGGLKKVEDIMDMDPPEIDFWELHSILKMYELFGDDYKNFIEIQDGESPVN